MLDSNVNIEAPPAVPDSPRTIARKMWAAEDQRRAEMKKKAEASRCEVKRKLIESAWSLQYAKNRERLRADSQHAKSEGTRVHHATNVLGADGPQPTPDTAQLLEASVAKRGPVEVERELWETMLAKNR